MLTRAQLEKKLSSEALATLAENPELWPEVLKRFRAQRSHEIELERKASAERCAKRHEEARALQESLEARRVARLEARLIKLRELRRDDLSALGTLKLLELKGPNVVRQNISRATFFRHKRRLAELDLRLNMEWPE
jgi:hypothetical protein